jgi:hypothetical protein
MAGPRRRPARGQHARFQLVCHPARGAERVAEPSRLQRALGAGGIGAHVRAAPRPATVLVDHHRPIATAHEPHQLAPGPTLPTAKARASRNMLHVAADADPSSPVVVAAAPAAASFAAASLAAACARVASHSSAAA